ncbi:MAG: tetratricopeptide repeat protein [Desulfocapsaceae bacterium]|nr:tetratricopeptide repeat protein [Desulfocapsaceae bacterium]
MKTGEGSDTGLEDWQPRHRHEAALQEAEALLKAAPHAIDARFVRAQLLMELGRTEEAKDAYLELLTLSPSHSGALNNLGALLHATGFTAAARTCYAQAAKQHPDDPMGHVNLANSFRQAGEGDLARKHYEIALRAAPDHAQAHQGLAFLLLEQGDEKGAERHRRLGFQGRAVQSWPYRGRRPPIPVLLLASAMGGNAPLSPFLDDHVYQVSMIYTEFYDLNSQLPPHRLLINAIGDADLCGPGLDIAGKISALSTAPLLNPPEAVLKTGRIANARRLGRIPDVITPGILCLPREILSAPGSLERLAAQGIALPFLLRTPGFHNGRNFFRVGNCDELTAALAVLPGRDITVMQFLDGRDADGKIRKYRIMFIDGRIYPLHAAISRHWKIHHVTAEMADNSEHRTEEEAFLTAMPEVLGKRAMQALRGIGEALGLDYAGADFSLDAQGRILLFEANAPMVVQPPDPDDRWAYRRAPVDRIIRAAVGMIAGRAAVIPPC